MGNCISRKSDTRRSNTSTTNSETHRYTSSGNETERQLDNNSQCLTERKSLDLSRPETHITHQEQLKQQKSSKETSNTVTGMDGACIIAKKVLAGLNQNEENKDTTKKTDEDLQSPIIMSNEQRSNQDPDIDTHKKTLDALETHFNQYKLSIDAFKIPELANDTIEKLQLKLKNGYGDHDLTQLPEMFLVHEYYKIRDAIMDEFYTKDEKLDIYPDKIKIKKSIEKILEEKFEYSKRKNKGFNSSETDTSEEIDHIMDLVKNKKLVSDKLSKLTNKWEVLSFIKENGKSMTEYDEKNIKYLYGNILEIRDKIYSIESLYQDLLKDANIYSEKEGKSRERNDLIRIDISSLCDKAKDDIDNLSIERNNLIKHYRAIHTYYSMKITPYILPCQRYDYTPPQGYSIFQSSKEAECGPTVTRTILATKNPYYKSDMTGKEVTEKFPSQHNGRGIDIREIPAVLKDLGHKVDYVFHDKPSAKLLEELSRDLSEPFVLSLKRKGTDGHSYFGCEITNREVEWNGKMYTVKGVGLGDPIGGESYWTTLDDIISDNTMIAGVTAPPIENL